MDKRFLDSEGLSLYDEEVKKYFNRTISTATLSSATKYVENRVGNLGSNISTVAAGILAEKGRAESAESSLEATIGTASKEAVGVEGEDGYEAPVEATGLTARIEELEEKTNYSLSWGALGQ